MPSRMIFVNLPVDDLDRSERFYEMLGWTVNRDFTDDNAACVSIDANICAMLLVRPFFETLVQRPVADTVTLIGSLYALALASRQEVDDLLEAALRAGGSEEINPDRCTQERAVGMYSRTFVDPDGHQWEVFNLTPPG